MISGVDFDYLLPRPALPRFLSRFRRIWPDWILEGERGTLFRPSEVGEALPFVAESGFVLYRDAAMRTRFHVDGGFTDASGASPISSWIPGWDSDLVHIDFVLDHQCAAAFVLAVHDAIASAIADVALALWHERGTRWLASAMEGAWVQSNWPAMMELAAVTRGGGRAVRSLPPIAARIGDSEDVPVGATLWIEDRLPSLSVVGFRDDGDARGFAAVARSVVRLLGQWHRVFYGPHPDSPDTNELPRFTMPPGDLEVRGDGLAIARPGRAMAWTPSVRPRLLTHATTERW